MPDTSPFPRLAPDDAPRLLGLAADFANFASRAERVCAVASLRRGRWTQLLPGDRAFAHIRLLERS